MSINAMYFLLIRRQRRPCLLAIDDGLSFAGQHAGRSTYNPAICEYYWAFAIQNKTEMSACKGVFNKSKWLLSLCLAAVNFAGSSFISFA